MQLTRRWIVWKKHWNPTQEKQPDNTGKNDASMKQLVFLLLITISQLSFAQNNYDNLINTTDEKKADALLEKARLKQATEDEKNELQRIAVLIQNKGQNQDP